MWREDAYVPEPSEVLDREILRVHQVDDAGDMIKAGVTGIIAAGDLTLAFPRPRHSNDPRTRRTVLRSEPLT